MSVESSARNLSTKFDLTRTAFGELSVAQNRVQAGWSFPYLLNTDKIRTYTFKGGTVNHDVNFAHIATGTDPGGVAEIRTEDQLSYTPGVGAIARFTAIFDTPVENSVQIIGIGDDFDGLFFGYNGLKFGILRRSKSVDTWAYQEDWNIDKHTTLNPQMGNVYQITFKWLGFGDQYFSIAKGTGDVEPVHQIHYSNKNLETSVDIPSLPVLMQVSNIGSTTNIEMRSPSSVAMSQGEAFPQAFTLPLGYSFSGAVAVGGNYLFSILNPFEYQSKPNRLYIEPALLTFANDTNKPATIRVLFNATLTTPSFADIDVSKSPAQYDTSAAAYSEGTEILASAIGRESGTVVDLTSILNGWKVWPTSEITFVCDAQAIGDVAAGFTFRSRV